jgi:hypothetical protein
MRCLRRLPCADAVVDVTFEVLLDLLLPPPPP